MGSVSACWRRDVGRVLGYYLLSQKGTGISSLHFTSRHLPLQSHLEPPLKPRRAQTLPQEPFTKSRLGLKPSQSPPPRPHTRRRCALIDRASDLPALYPRPAASQSIAAACPSCLLASSLRAWRVDSAVFVQSIWTKQNMAAERDPSAESSEWAGFSEEGDDDMDFEVSDAPFSVGTLLRWEDGSGLTVFCALAGEFGARRPGRGRWGRRRDDGVF